MTLTAQSSLAVEVTWTPPSGGSDDIGWYLVTLSSRRAGEVDLTMNVTAQTTSVVFNSLTVGTVYTAEVSAGNVVGNSSSATNTIDFDSECIYC